MKNSLNNLTDGTIIYVDSNIFIYDATNHPKYATSCSTFLDRIESGKITGVTSVLSVNETVHKLSIIHRDIIKIKEEADVNNSVD